MEVHITSLVLILYEKKERVTGHLRDKQTLLVGY